MIALRYHEATKHYFNRFARSRGYLDWATQPDPFRRYDGAPRVDLSREAVAADVDYDAMFDRVAPAVAFAPSSLADWLRCGMGLSAWKQYQHSRWALRVNPSSGNLHPTEAYVVHGDGVFHYAPREHVLEQRAQFGDQVWRHFTAGRDGVLIALTSIHWREAWKYGERAFRYCQHDIGHAIGALSLSAARLGWRMTLLTSWSDAQIATLLGIDRDHDFADAEREEPECVAVVTAADSDIAPWLTSDPDVLVSAARAASWRGTANQLSSGHVEWPIVDEVSVATQFPGGQSLTAQGRIEMPAPGLENRTRPTTGLAGPVNPPRARDIIIQRRSAVAFDPRATTPRQTFLDMLARVQPRSVPWDAIDWPPQVHLVLFVHRVDGLTPGVYAYLRDPLVRDQWRSAMREEFLWEPVSGAPDLHLLLPTDVSWPANRISCDQDIAGDGFFSLAMIARFGPSLAERGEWFYRRLFWECGLIGQVLYLEAEAAGGRATGIGCFYDDAVHDLMGLSGDAWQSLYHFSAGAPVDDPRLTTRAGYDWEEVEQVEEVEKVKVEK